MKGRRLRHSLSGRLTLLFIGMAVLFLVLVGAGIGHSFREHVATTLHPHLQRYIEYIRRDIGNPPDLERAASLSRDLPLHIQIAGPDVRWASHGSPVDLSALKLRSHGIGADSLHRHGDLQGTEFLLVEDGPYTFAFSVPTHRTWWRIALPLVALLLVLTLLYHATRLLIRPIGPIQSGIERIGAGELDHRIDVKRRDELGDLAGSINGMADDIRRMLEAKRQLLLAISHELRSPLTRAKLAVAMLEDVAQREEITRDLDELDRLVEELLETERLSGRHRAIDRRLTDINALVAELIKRFFQGVALTLVLPQEVVQVHLDSARVKLLIKNLLDNALRHTPAGGRPPRLSVERRDVGVRICVRDYGPGIAPEHLTHLTEPFYRVDPARQRETGGYGLGLYLCRVIAEAHGGSLQIDSQLGQGTTVNVLLREADDATGP